MSQLEKGLKLPTAEAIDSWNSLDTKPLADSNACAVPKTVFVEIDNESYYNRSLFEKEHPMLTAASNISFIKLFNDHIERAEMLINKIYTRRSISQAIAPFVQARKDSTIPEAKRDYEEIFNLCQDIMVFIKDAVNGIHHLFDFTTIWQAGHYSDVLIDVTCTLFFKICTIDEMKLIKSSLTNDLTNFKNLALGNQYTTPEIAELRSWMPIKNYIDSSLLKSEEGKSKLEKQNLASIFASHIVSRLEKTEYLKPEMQYVYIRFLMFLGKYHEYKPETLTAMAKQACAHPLLPLAYEVSINVPEYCKQIPGFDKEYSKQTSDQKSTGDRLSQLQKELESGIAELPSQVAAASAGKLSADRLYEITLKLIRSIAATKNALREQLAYKLANPSTNGASDEKQFMYELSIRKGYSQAELKTLLQLLMLWRSLSDQLREASEIISKLISKYISNIFQECIKNTSQIALRKVKPAFEQRLREILETMASFVGDWSPGEEMFPVSKKKRPPHTIVGRDSAPNLAAIEFVRIQIQHIINPTSEFMKGGSKKLFRQDKVVDLYKKFIADSLNWADILNFNEILFDLADQSDLFFKEVQLDLNKTINFPIRSSLPFVLSEFTLNNFMIPELTELVFYPLGIYNDAARVAQFKLKSLYLLDEIKAEADMCVQTLSLMISEFTFMSFRTFATLRYLPPTFPRPNQRQEISTGWPESRAYRLVTLLQQNQFYLHYKLIDMKSLISAQIEASFTDALMKLVRVASLSTLVAVDQGIEILRETHRLLTEQGIILTRFDTLLKVAVGDTIPNSFVSIFATNMIKSICGKVARHCYLRTNPLRLTNPQPKELPKSAFSGTLGKVLRMAYEPTTSPITVEHFCCLQKLFDDGSMFYFIQKFNQEFGKYAQKLVTAYTLVLEQSGVRRIADVSLLTSAQLVFDRYEGAYGGYTDDPDVKKLISEMKTIGNHLAIANMIDIAMSNSRLTRAQIIAFFRGVGLDGKEHNDVEKLLPGVMAQLMKEDGNTIPNGRDVYPLVLTMCLGTLMKSINENIELFDEKSTTVLDFTSLKGFAAIWSVLEFIFNYAEAIRTEKAESPFENYGEGVMLTAGAILSILKQERIYLAANIGRRIQRVKEVDFAANMEIKLAKFCAVNQYEAASLEWALSVFQPIIKHINATGQIE